jgi:hypothetical protein
MVAAVVVSWSRTQRRVPWTEVALLLLAAGWILLATRTVALGALIVCPLVARVLHDSIGHARRGPSAFEMWSLRLSAVAIACVAALIVPQTAADPAKVPAALDAELDRLPPGSVVFNDYKLGGWLRWRHPALEPVVDGMTEAYSVEHLQEFGRVLGVAADWQTTLDAWEPSAALLPQRSPLATALVEQQDWELVGDDEGYVLLVPTAS